MIAHFTRKSLMALFLSTMVFTAVAEEKKDDAKEDEKKEETLVDILEKKDAFEGFVDIYRDKEDGSGLVVFDESQLDTPFLYFVSTVDGAVTAGTFRGQFRGSRLIEFRRNFDRIEVVSTTPRFYFDPENAVSRAANANISEAILVSTN
jgi:hypothetical protein